MSFFESCGKNNIMKKHHTKFTGKQRQMGNSMTREKIWQAVLGEIELNIGRTSFTTWFTDTHITSMKNNKAVIGVPTGFSKEWLKSKYDKQILKSLRNFCTDIKEVEYVVGENTKNTAHRKQKNKPNKLTIEKNLKNHRYTARKRTGINPRYDFGSFVVGNNNALAEAAARAVAETPGFKFNPLFIYGGVGLGKTHLLQAIGNQIAKRKKESTVQYATTENFAHDLIDSIRQNKVMEFKKRYRKIDVLLLDDVQFITKKEKTQEELFHIFNHLYQGGKQIVICSDRPPSEIATLKDRLRSRFEGGMMADISQPDLETRTAILDSKAREQGIELKQEVLEYIASNIQNNIRELEGALNKFIATCQLQEWDSDLRSAKLVLAAIISTHQKEAVTPQFIIKKVSKFFDVSKDELLGTSRRKDIVRPRQIAICLMRKEGQFSYPAIGKFFNKDHSTIMHSYRKIDDAIKENETILREFNAVRDFLYRN